MIIKFELCNSCEIEMRGMHKMQNGTYCEISAVSISLIRLKREISRHTLIKLFHVLMNEINSITVPFFVTMKLKWII